MITNRLVLPIIGSLFAACSSDGGGPPPVTPPPPSGEKIAFTEDPYRGLPENSEGKKIIFDGESMGGAISITADERLRDPVTAKGACLTVLFGCMNETSSSDEAWVTCVDRAPTCATSTPWEEAACCPAACKSAFANSRANKSVREALIESFAWGKNCYPGLSEFVSGS